MAYFDPHAFTALPRVAAADPAGLGALEWEVVQLARRDRLSSLRAPGRLSRLAAFLFGARPNPRLADPRLEALRRLAVLAWHHGYALPVSAIKLAKERGFTPEQVEMLLAGIAAARQPQGRRAAA